MRKFPLFALLALCLSPSAFANTEVKIECTPSIGNTGLTVGKFAFDVGFDNCAVTRLNGRSSNVKIDWVAFDNLEATGLVMSNSTLNVVCDVNDGASVEGKYTITSGGAAAYGVGGMLAFARNESGSCTAIGASVGLGAEYIKSGTLEIRMMPASQE